MALLLSDVTQKDIDMYIMVINARLLHHSVDLFCALGYCNTSASALLHLPLAITFSTNSHTTTIKSNYDTTRNGPVVNDGNYIICHLLGYIWCTSFDVSILFVTVQCCFTIVCAIVDNIYPCTKNVTSFVSMVYSTIHIN